MNGEDLDPDSGVDHLGHALACLNIVVDSIAIGTLVDGRVPSADLTDWYAQLTPVVALLGAKHAKLKPRHFTIGDTP